MWPEKGFVPGQPASPGGQQAGPSAPAPAPDKGLPSWVVPAALIGGVVLIGVVVLR